MAFAKLLHDYIDLQLINKFQNILYQNLSENMVVCKRRNGFHFTISLFAKKVITNDLKTNL